MGRISEIYAYLTSQPEKLTELKKELYYISVNDKTKSVREELKLYKQDNKDELQMLL